VIELHIGLVQMRCEKADIAQNLTSTSHCIDDAVLQGVDILCFPEASITGYVDPVRFPGGVVRLDSLAVADFVALTRESPMTVIGGLVEENPAGLPFLTQFVARGGQLLGYYRKRTIPADEAHLFAAGTLPATFALPQVTVGLAICADIENRRVFADCAGQGAKVIFECAAPGLYGDQATRDWSSGYGWWRGECHEKLARYARELGVCIAVATQAGRTCDEDFPGGGYVFGPDGTPLAATDNWSEGLLYARIRL
jgi:predicted amidohydrolase